jgi:hypothetical protein
MQDAKRNLQKAVGTLTTGFKPENKDLLHTGEEILEIASDLVEQMDRKARPKKRRASEGAENV